MDSSRARTKRRKIRRDLDLLRFRLRNVDSTVDSSYSSTDTAILNNEIHKKFYRIVYITINDLNYFF